MTGLMHGIRVVDMTQYLSGPTATRLMAEMGADIVKVEQAPNGDPSRGLMVSRDGRSGYHVQQNRGKKSLCIDFDTADGRAVLERLIAGADVLVENYGHGVLERRGLDYESLRTRYPRLIVASISGFGRTGPYSDRSAFDLIAQAYSGILAMTGDADGPPMPIGTNFADVTAGVHAACAVGYALFHRERTGEGQHCDIAMVDSMYHALDTSIQGHALTGGKWIPRRSGEKSPVNAPQGVFRTPDGYIVVQTAEAQWPGFCRAIDRPDLEHDERYVNMVARWKHRDELNRLIEDAFDRLGSAAEVIRRLEAERVPCAPVLSPHETITHPYFTSRGAVRTVTDPVLGNVTIPGNPLRFSTQPEPLELVAPALGEHNHDVLSGLGYSDDEIARLHEDGVLRRKDT